MRYLIAFSILVFVVTGSSFGLLYDFNDARQEEDWKIFAGAGEIKDGQYILQKTDATDGIAAIGEADWTDCEVTCKGTLLEGSADNIGLVWRLLDGKTFYVFSIRMDQRVGYCGCLAGAWMNGGSPVNPQPFSTEIDREYEMKLIVKGKSFQFYVDGEDMGKWEDDQLKEGMVGLRVWNAVMAADDFEINGPGIPASAVDSQGKLASAWGEIKKL